VCFWGEQVVQYFFLLTSKCFCFCEQVVQPTASKLAQDDYLNASDTTSAAAKPKIE
jgi:hypothetical protein